MHVTAKKERLLDWLLGLGHYHFVLHSFCKGSADCNTLDGDHRIICSSVKIITLYYTDVASIAHNFDRNQCILGI